MRINGLVTRIAGALALCLALSACESLPDLENWFNPKKPLPGERKAVFPEGVPGVAQGVPPDLVRGYQPPVEQQPPVAEAPPEKPRPTVQPKPRRTTVAVPTRPPPTSVTVQPNTSTSAPPPPSSWPAPPGQTQQPAQQPTQQSTPPPPAWPTQQSGAQAPSPWPSAPPPGTFSR